MHIHFGIVVALLVIAFLAGFLLRGWFGDKSPAEQAADDREQMAALSTGMVPGEVFDVPPRRHRTGGLVLPAGDILRTHTGGIVDLRPGEVPAILQNGETRDELKIRTPGKAPKPHAWPKAPKRRGGDRSRRRP